MDEPLLRYRPLGRTGLRVSELFLGTLGFGESGGGMAIDECRAVLDRYAGAGGNVIDTAINYTGGESERVVGELLEGRRDRFVVATKYTWTRDGHDPNAAGTHRKNLRLSLEESLRRLRTDYVDLLWVHVWDRHTPVEETMRALDDAVRAGHVLAVGFSDTPAWVVSRADALAAQHGWAPPAAVQVPYSVIRRDAERELLPMAEALGLSVATWGPTAHGLLAGRPADGEALDAPEQAAVEAVREIAGELGASPAQVAIAWTRARSPAVHPILGVSSARQLADSLGTLAVALPADAVRRLDEATGFTPGFPLDLIAAASPTVFGEVSARVDGR